MKGLKKSSVQRVTKMVHSFNQHIYNQNMSYPENKIACLHLSNEIESV